MAAASASTSGSMRSKGASSKARFAAGQAHRDVGQIERLSRERAAARVREPEQAGRGDPIDSREPRRRVRPLAQPQPEQPPFFGREGR